MATSRPAPSRGLVHCGFKTGLTVGFATRQDNTGENSISLAYAAARADDDVTNGFATLITRRPALSRSPSLANSVTAATLGMSSSLPSTPAPGFPLHHSALGDLLLPTYLHPPVSPSLPPSAYPKLA